MRLEVTKRADLAVRALVVLADGRRRKSAELAEALETSAGFVPQVLGPLLAREWVRSEPGPTGGYVLVVDPAGLSLLEVIEAVDGPTDTGRCVVEDRPCGGRSPCTLHHAWAEARRSLLAELGGARVADLGGAV